MSWWDTYQTWRPEDSWDRYQAWRLETRTRFVATTVALRALIVFFVFELFAGSSVGRALLVTAIFAALGIPVFWFWYPRAKVKSQVTPVPSRTTPV